MISTLSICCGLLFILCHASFFFTVSGHAYLVSPIPRNIYCSINETQCVTPFPQGPVWGLPTGASLATYSPVTLTTCNGSTLLAAAPIGNTDDPGFTTPVPTTWTAGSRQNLTFFVSQIHDEDQTSFPTDGWQILYRDGANSSNQFQVISSLYNGVNTTDPHPADFQLGETVSVEIIVPNTITDKGEFQFYWRNNEVNPAPGVTGVMWISCADVRITNSAFSSVYFNLNFVGILSLLGMLVAMVF
jgi:hypothetical protein